MKSKVKGRLETTKNKKRSEKSLVILRGRCQTSLALCSLNLGINQDASLTTLLSALRLRSTQFAFT